METVIHIRKNNHHFPMRNLSCYLITLAFCCLFSTAKSQELDPKKQYEVVCVGFYNLENLFDTLVDPDTAKILQEDFTPLGQKKWNTEKYNKKMANLSEVISQLGTESTPDGAAVLGVCEIENRSVLEDLVKTGKLAERGYEIVHYESPDHRGIDVGLLYQPKYFKVLSSKTFTLRLQDDPKFTTRDQLLVTGELKGEKVHFMVAHWPSRRGGAKKSSPKRVAAGELAKSVIDSLRKDDPMTKVIFMGDLNDDPTNASMKEGMLSVGKVSKMEEGSLYNPMEKLYKQGVGTLAWRDTWNLFDQMVFTPGYLSQNGNYSSFKFYKAVVYNKAFLKQKTGNFQGYPWRSYVGPNFIGGYSDHFPVYSLLIRERK